MKLEIRTSPEIREAGEMKLVGYPILFNSLSEDLGGFRERVSPIAVERTLKEQPDVFALAFHDYKQVLGRTSAGTMKLLVEDRGVKCEVDLPDTSYGRDLWASVKRGDIKGMSFGFYIRDNQWEKLNEEYVSTLLDIDLREVSVVSVPAYSQTSVSVRHLTPTLLPIYSRQIEIARLRMSHN